MDLESIAEQVFEQLSLSTDTSDITPSGLRQNGRLCVNFVDAVSGAPNRSYYKLYRGLLSWVNPHLDVFVCSEKIHGFTHQHEFPNEYSRKKRTVDIPDLAVVLFLQEQNEDGPGKMSQVQEFFRNKPWKFHHSEFVGQGRIQACPRSNHDYYFVKNDLPLCSVRQIHCGEEHVRLVRFVTAAHWKDSIKLYSLLLYQEADAMKHDFCVFTVEKFAAVDLQLALKKLPKGIEPRRTKRTVLSFKVNDMSYLVPLLPYSCVRIADNRWRTYDLDRNEIHLEMEDTLSHSKAQSAFTPVTRKTLKQSVTDKLSPRVFLNKRLERSDPYSADYEHHHTDSGFMEDRSDDSIEASHTLKAAKHHRKTIPHIKEDLHSSIVPLIEEHKTSLVVHDDSTVQKQQDQTEKETNLFTPSDNSSVDSSTHMCSEDAQQIKLLIQNCDRLKTLCSSPILKDNVTSNNEISNDELHSNSSSEISHMNPSKSIHKHQNSSPPHFISQVPNKTAIKSSSQQKSLIKHSVPNHGCPSPCGSSVHSDCRLSISSHNSSIDSNCQLTSSFLQKCDNPPICHSSPKLRTDSSRSGTPIVNDAAGKQDESDGTDKTSHGCDMREMVRKEKPESHDKMRVEESQSSVSQENLSYDGRIVVKKEEYKMIGRKSPEIPKTIHGIERKVSESKLLQGIKGRPALPSYQEAVTQLKSQRNQDAQKCVGLLDSMANKKDDNQIDDTCLKYVPRANIDKRLPFALCSSTECLNTSLEDMSPAEGEPLDEVKRTSLNGKRVRFNDQNENFIYEAVELADIVYNVDDDSVDEDDEVFNDECEALRIHNKAEGMETQEKFQEISYSDTALHYDVNSKEEDDIGFYI